LSDIEKLRNRLKQFVESPTDLMNQELKMTMTELILQQETSHDLRRKIHELEESISQQTMDLENELENGPIRLIQVDPEAELGEGLDDVEDGKSSSRTYDNNGNPPRRNGVSAASDDYANQNKKKIFSTSSQQCQRRFCFYHFGWWW